ncbi:MAG: hypothetical protein BWZ10_01037 [candidate division BRC1 bacterium ADurb.BinA364]|nr:MAG: hypothetical protein BWZ10_01037 [candidate division BRC1 bacterium ADurb.BinA364]
MLDEQERQDARGGHSRAGPDGGPGQPGAAHRPALDQPGGQNEQRQIARRRPVQADRHHPGQNAEKERQGQAGEQEIKPARIAIGPPKRESAPGPPGRDPIQNRPQGQNRAQRVFQGVLAVQTSLGQIAAPPLKRVVDPAVLGVPYQIGRKNQQRDGQRHPGAGRFQPGAMRRRERQKHPERRQQDPGVEFAQQRRPRRRSGGQPPSGLSAFGGQPKEAPGQQHEQQQRSVGPDHRPSGQKQRRGGEEKRREPGRAPVGEQRAGQGEQGPQGQGEEKDRRGARRHNRAVDPAEQQCAGPGGHRRMIEIARRQMPPPEPVIGLAGDQRRAPGDQQPRRRGGENEPKQFSAVGHEKQPKRKAARGEKRLEAKGGYSTPRSTAYCSTISARAAPCEKRRNSSQL